MALFVPCVLCIFKCLTDLILPSHYNFAIQAVCKNGPVIAHRYGDVVKESPIDKLDQNSGRMVKFFVSLHVLHLKFNA